MEREAVNLAESIRQSLLDATKAKDKSRISILRMIRSALQNREKDLRHPLSDDEVIEVLSSLAKKAKESIEQFSKGGRQDLVEKEEAELKVILSFMPQQLDEEGIRSVLQDVISEVGAKGPKDLGPVMKAAMARLKGRAEGRVVQQIARDLLSEIQS
jgi:hypothetical protein